MAESITTLKAQLAEANERNRHQDEEWDYLIRDTLTLHDQARHVHGTLRLMLEYINESEIIMRNLGYAQESAVLKNLFNELVSRLRRQREACQRAVEGMGGTLENLEQWKGKVRA